jgi:hypothetical protein
MGCVVSGKTELAEPLQTPPFVVGVVGSDFVLGGVSLINYQDYPEPDATTFEFDATVYELVADKQLLYVVYNNKKRLGVGGAQLLAPTVGIARDLKLVLTSEQFPQPPVGQLNGQCYRLEVVVAPEFVVDEQGNLVPSDLESSATGRWTIGVTRDSQQVVDLRKCL